MIKKILISLWKGQNTFGKFQTILIITMALFIWKQSFEFGVYKRSHINDLEKYKQDNIDSLKAVNTKKIRSIKAAKAKTVKFLDKSNRIEEKRKRDEKAIYNSIVDDKRRNRFLSKHQK